MSEKPVVDYRTLLKDAVVSLDRLRARVLALESEKLEPIAVIGMACRFPGRAADVEGFWDLVHAGESAITEVPPDRWDVDAYYDPDPEAPGKIYSRWGGFVRDVDRFEPQFFGISPREATTMDPQQRLLLEVAWEALEHAGQDPARLAGTPAGVFVGISFSEYGALLHRHVPETARDLYSGTGNALSIAAGRVSYALGLHGPAMAVDTACSSSLVSVHLAIQSLRNTECTVALAGGVSLILSPDGSLVTCRGRMLAFDGRCKTFDAAADGYVRGEGCGIVVLKRLKDAVRDGDRILSVLLGSAVNQDGRSSGLTAPNGAAQEALLRSALRNAGVGLDRISYIEAHGTGTPLGDPIEMRAIDAVFSQGRGPGSTLRVGSVKTNIGHLESAAGIAGLIKVIAALQHRRIPAHLNLQTRSARIPWAEMPIEVPTTGLDWPETGAPRTAGVSAFGFSGTNAHIVVQEAPVPADEAPSTRPWHLLTLSARSDSALRVMAGLYERHLTVRTPGDLADVCFTANSGRARLERRAAIVAPSVDEARKALRAVASGGDAAGASLGHVRETDPPKIAFLFTGQGSQYPGMGRELFDSLPVFREAMEECDALLGEIDGRRLLSVVYPAESGPAADALLQQTGFAQPALFAVEYSLARLWRSFGVEPGAVMGHSVGEYAAACVAGIFTVADGLKLLEARGRLMQALPAGGAMLAVSGDADVVRRALPPGTATLSVAAINGARDLVLSGDAGELRAVEQVLADAGIHSTWLNVSHAFHSPLMASMVGEFRRSAEAVTYRRPSLRIVSNVTAGTPSDGEPMDADYWCRHVLAPVRFSESLEALRAQGYDVAVEIGPHPVLIGLGRKSDAAGSGVWLPSLRRGRSDWQQMLQTLGDLFVRGVDFSAEALERPRRARRVSLPSYPFERERYWIDSATASHAPQPARPAGASWPGVRVRSPLTADVVFEAEVSASTVPLLADHVVYGEMLFPAAGLLDLAFSAAAAAFDGSARRLSHFEIHEPLRITGDDRRIVQTVLTQPQGGRSGFRIYSAPADGSAATWTAHASGEIWLAAHGGSPAMPGTVGDIRSRCGDTIPAQTFYERLDSAGIEYGPSFRGIEQLWMGPGEALGLLSPRASAASPGAFVVHPALLDTGFQVLGAACAAMSPGASGDDLFLPVGIDAITIAGASFDGPIWSYASLREPAPGDVETVTADLWWVDDSGSPLLHIEGFTAKRARRSALQRSARHLGTWLHEIDWRPVDRVDASAAPTRRWMVLGEGTGVAADLAAQLRASGLDCAMVVPGHGFDRLGDDTYVVDPVSRESLDLMLRRLLATSGDRVGVVHAFGASPDTADDIDAAQRRICGSLLALAQALSARAGGNVRLWTVTRGARAVDASQGADPVGATVWGLGQVIAAEYAELRPVRIDLDPAEAPEQMRLLLDELQYGEDEDQVALRGDRRFVARLVALGHGRGRPRLSVPRDGWQLAIPQRGTIDNLRFDTAERRAPASGEIEVRVHATGLNLRDVLNVLGMYPGDPGPLGNECSGTVVAVGDGVTGLSPGDDVMCMGGGSFRPYFTCDSRMVIPKPARLTHAQAAGVPIAFLTALYGLKHIGALKAGERVLIHAAAGGVGMAAVQVALSAGAEVFGTAGSASKRRLLERLGVRHVLCSRTLEFSSEIDRITGGRGVDVVLNSLTGEFITESLRVLAPGGRFVEIGKADVWDSRRVASVNPHVRYATFDLGDVLISDRELARSLYAALLDGLSGGTLHPLPVTVFPLDEAPSAFRFMAQARHVGKVVVVDPRVLPRAGSVDGRLFADDAAYVVTGGLGALGRSAAEWMIDRGACHVVLAGRSAPSAGAVDEIRQLEARGARIRIVLADVSSEAGVRGLLSAVDEAGLPLKGIIHAAGVLHDGMLEGQSWADIERVLAPKVSGALLLDRLTRDRALDHFVMFSSVASLMGAAGQGAYAAANAALDALAHRRRSMGLAAQSINWGPWSDRGMAASLSDRQRDLMTSMGFGMIGTADGLACLDSIVAAGTPQVAVVPARWDRVCGRFTTGQVPPLLRALADVSAGRAAAGGGNSGAAPAGEPPPAADRLVEATPAERLRTLTQYLVGRVAWVLQIDAHGLDPARSLPTMGLDSLMAVELKGRIESDLRVELPIAELLRGPSTEQLAEILIGLMMSARGAAGTAAGRLVDGNDGAGIPTEMEVGEI